MDRFMELALRLARKADPFPNPKVGAVLVKEGKVIGVGYHKAPGKPHAEIEAIHDAKRRTRNPDAPCGATLYVTLEPCSHSMKRTPPCTDAIISCGITKVVYGMDDPNPLVSGATVLRKAGVETRGPAAKKKAAELNKRYIEDVRRKPFVAIKVAMSADGKTATRTGDSRWISGRKSRELVHKMRTEYDAVMVGAGTVIADDPQLTSHGKGRDPYRIIVDGKLKTPLGAKVIGKDRKIIIAACEGASRRKARLLSRNAQVFLSGKRKVDLKKLVHALGALGMKKIVIEGGGELNAEALGAGIVDRLYIFIAPKIIGGKEARGVFGGVGAERIKDSVKLKKVKERRIGEDLLLEYDLIR